MCCFKLFIAGPTIKTAAALSAVVFLFCITGCCNGKNTPDSDKQFRSSTTHKSDSKRPVRRRASDYSRIPGNYPAGWQTSTAGN